MKMMRLIPESVLGARPLLAGSSLAIFGTSVVGPVLAANAQSTPDSSAPPAAATDDSPTSAEGPSGTSPIADPTDPSLGPLIDLDPLVVLATRGPRDSFDTPAIVDVVTARDISEAQYRTLPDALREIPGVMVQKTGYAQGSPYIRGFTGFRNLLLIDGIRLNNSVFRDGPNQYWNTIDPFSIERIEVVKGPSSVLYGSDAIGGTVGVFSKSNDTWTEGVGVGGRLVGRGSTGERSLQGRVELGASWQDEIGAYAGGTWKDFGDLRAGSGVQPNTGYDEWDVDTKFQWRLGDSWELVAAYQAVHQSNAWRTHKTTSAWPYAGTTSGDEQRRVLAQDRQLGYLQLHGRDLAEFVDDAVVSVSWQVQGESQDRVRGDGRQDVQGTDANTLGVWAQLASDTAIGRLTYGFSYYRDWVDSFRTDWNADGSLKGEAIQGPVADDSTYDLFGVYLQDEIPVGERFDLVIGGRWNWARAHAGRAEDPVSGDATSFTETYQAFVGSIRTVVHLDDPRHWNLFGGVSQGFRAPNLSDLTRLDTARSDEIETVSPDLDPERFLAYEVGLKASYDDLFLQGSWYWTQIRDQIVRTPTGRVIDGDREVTKVNAGDGWVQGVDLSGTWRFHPNWSTFGAFSWLEGEIDAYPTSDPIEVRESLTRQMATNGQVGLRWATLDQAIWVEGVVTMWAAQDRLSFGDQRDTQRVPSGGTPGYTVASIRGGWQIDPMWSVTLTLDNLTDKDYRVHGSGVNESGFNAILGVECRF